ncbi:elongation of very long chain fatty acids protein AAEL008004-like [Argiope bruennichi]|uniref:elongation of very long chain fatty acids protein AAEL008004-like n=1 Tax=Argiope bruennichi TaxID=94029 RepID=UPI0024946A6F|nr:elongation of very long chain fatty acids protein AAEL008004-like [Argiope bruennichi]XP_055933910.1 elongation of very long chain fatty acids protein AAEL008004-like [Argiope bruennichi]XP_055933911.1 elongation of very long chain fatty acids protein AAEL008004-like [Argiope bruennichi]XP_055933912.1 elongation of very long chain fatty acids protein AAEL008004-like [Argiope bruennichi]
MTTLVKSVSDVYDEYMANGDPRVTKWPLMEGPGPTFLLVILYVLFVKKIGPAWMMDKKPYDLRYPMFLYNLVLVFTNFYLLLESFRILFKPTSKWFCRIDNHNDPDALRLAELGWWFFFMKFIEFADTIFFVLRKKSKHISTLHVVHHAVVPIAVWGGFRVEPGNYNYFFPLINTIVHTVMYSYYGLAALGPSVQKYLWWKKYLTTFQMIQFVMVFFYVMTLMIGNCKVSKFIIYLNMFLAGLFLLMFYDYFQNTYLKKRAIRKQKDLDEKNERLRAEKEASEKNGNLHSGNNGIIQNGVQNGVAKTIVKKDQ